MMASRLWAALLLDTAFILLSVASPAARRCYWCGPLAEQVHRSRRSAPCGASDHVTVCEPGYDYCAVVATSPPRVESRYCVKMYQDECYPLYCNSTKTWKMTCPCRGDLCNGPNTEREIEAFARLPTLVAKTQNARIKKRTAIAAPHLIKHDGKRKIVSNSDAEIHNISNLSTNDTNNITNDNIVTENEVITKTVNDPSHLSQNMQSDQPTNIVIEHRDAETDSQNTVANQDNMQTTILVDNQLIEIEIHVSDPTVESNTMKENELMCTESPTTVEPDAANKNTEPVKKEVEFTSTTMNSVAMNEPSTKTIEIVNVDPDETKSTTLVTQQETTETKLHTEPPTKTIEIIQNDQPMNSEEQMQNDAPPINPTDSEQIVKNTEIIKTGESTKDSVKISGGIPTAEALQQNGNAPVTAAPVPVTEKPTEPTTTEATTIGILTTQEQIMKMPTTPASKHKNEAMRITTSSALLLIFIIYL